MNSDPDNLRDLTVEGIRRQEERDFLGAAAVFEEAARIAPSSAEVLSRLAYAYERLERLSEAATWYGRAVAADPSIAWVWARLGTLAFEQGELGCARELYERALALDSGLPEAHWGVARVLVGDGDLSQALTHAERAAELVPGQARYAAYVGYVHELEGRAHEAEQWYGKVLEVDPSWVSVHLRLGWLCLRQDRWCEAEAHFRSATESPPDELEPWAAWLGLAEALYLLGDYEGALDANRRTVVLGWPRQQALEQEGRIWLAADEPVKAERALREAMELGEDTAKVRCNLAAALAAQARPAEAESEFLRAIEVDPGEGGNWEAYGEFREDQGQYDRAESAYRRAVELDPQWDRALWLLLRLLLLRDRAQEALDLALSTDADRLDPVLRAALLALGGRREEAADILSKYDPESAVRRDPALLGFALEAMGDRQAARRAYEEAAEQGQRLARERLERLLSDGPG